MIHRLGVVGAGSMGAAIAALAASAGLSVVLLDVKGPVDDPAAPARRGLERAAQQRAFLDPQAVSRVQVGNVEDDLATLRDCQWVLEAIVEDLQAKRILLDRLAALLPASTVVTTNTSTFTLEALAPTTDPSWSRRFFATHFFNPPRALALTEVAALPEADSAQLDAFVRFLEQRLGRRVLRTRSTPGFVANRFGIYALVQAIRLTGELGLTIEEADVLTGPLLGRPRSATFRTVDLTGLDMLVLGTRSLQALTSDDYAVPDWVIALYDQGYFGDKSGQGFSKRQADQVMMYDIPTRTYRPYQSPSIPRIDELMALPLPQRLTGAITLPDPYGTYVRQLLGRTFAYVLQRTPEVADDILTVDHALEWGFGWAAGPYRQMDMLGLSTVKALLDEVGASPSPLFSHAQRAGGFFRDGQVMAVHRDGMVAIEQLPSAQRAAQIQTREMLNHARSVKLAPGIIAVRPTSLRAVPEALTAAQAQGANGIVLVPAFASGGYPFDELLHLADAEDWSALKAQLQQLGEAFIRVAECSRPVVVVLDGDARGAATALALWADATIAYLTAQVGFPGLAEGLLPFGALTGLLRQSRNGRDVEQALATLRASEQLPSAQIAATHGVLGRYGFITLDRDGLLSHAAALAQVLVATRPLEMPQQLQSTSCEAEALPAVLRALADHVVRLTDAATVTEMLAAEQAAWIALLQNPTTRNTAREAAQSLVQRRR